MKYALILAALILLVGVSEILGRSGSNRRGGSRGRGRGGGRRGGDQEGERGGQQGRGRGSRHDDDDDDDDDDHRPPRFSNVRKYCWLTDLDEANTNIEVDVDEFARVNIKRNVSVMVSRDRDLLDTEFNRHHTMFDFTTGKMGIRFRIPLPPGPIDDTSDDGANLQNHGFNWRFLRARPLDLCFVGDSLTSMTQTMTEFESRQSMVEVSTGARSSYSVAAANKLTLEQLKALSPAIAKFCCRAARLGNAYQLSSSGIVVPPPTTQAPTTTKAPTTTQAPTTTKAPTTTQAPTTTMPPTTTTGAPPPPPPNHPGVSPAIVPITPPAYLLASGFMNPANPGQSIPYQISFASDVVFNFKQPRPFRRRG